MRSIGIATDQEIFSEETGNAIPCYGFLRGLMAHFARMNAAPSEPAEIMKVVIENHLAVRLSGHSSYSDVIGSDGRCVTA